MNNNQFSILVGLVILIACMIFLILPKVLPQPPTLPILDNTIEQLKNTSQELSGVYEELCMLYYKQGFDLGYSSGKYNTPVKIYYGIYLNESLLSYFEKYGDRYFSEEFMDSLRNYE